MRIHLRLLAAISSLIVACAHDAPPLRSQAPAAASPQESAHVNGADLRYVEPGSGLPMVFVHGSLGGLETFQGQAEAFSRRYRTIAYSRRYHPPNSPPADDAEYAMAVHAADLEALIHALNAKPAIVVGASYGAYTSLFLAVRHPELVRALILGEPPLLPWLQESEEGKKVLAAFRAGVLDPAIAAFARGDDEGGLRAFIDGVSGKAGAFDALPPALRAQFLPRAPEMRREMLTAFERYMPAISCAEVSGLRMPILLVEGERSPELFRIVIGQLARCAPSAQRATVPNAGHAMHRANARFYDDTLSRFLADHGL